MIHGLCHHENFIHFSNVRYIGVIPWLSFNIMYIAHQNLCIRYKYIWLLIYQFNKVLVITNKPSVHNDECRGRFLGSLVVFPFGVIHIPQSVLNLQFHKLIWISNCYKNYISIYEFIENFLYLHFVLINSYLWFRFPLSRLKCPRTF